MAQMMFFLFHLVVSEPHLGVMVKGFYGVAVRLVFFLFLGGLLPKNLLGILDFWDKISLVSRDPDDDRIECGSSKDFSFLLIKKRL